MVMRPAKREEGRKGKKGNNKGQEGNLGKSLCAPLLECDAGGQAPILGSASSALLRASIPVLAHDGHPLPPFRFGLNVRGKRPRRLCARRRGSRALRSPPAHSGAPLRDPSLFSAKERDRRKKGRGRPDDHRESLLRQNVLSRCVNELKNLPERGRDDAQSTRRDERENGRNQA
jgi:hypothetical protein